MVEKINRYLNIIIVIKLIIISYFIYSLVKGGSAMDKGIIGVI